MIPEPKIQHLIPRLGIFDPYLDTLGGGERYCLSLAEAMLKQGWQVDLFWSEMAIKEKLTEKFGLGLERLNFVNYQPANCHLWQRRQFESKYDALFWISDGSLPFLFAKRNWLHFQVPFKNVLRLNLINRVKLKRIEKIICNSRFTKSFIDGQLKTQSIVIYPPVDITPIQPGKKENLILSVGRFSQLLQSKRQDVLVEAFKRMIGDGLKGWKLVLAGGSEVGGKEYVEKLKNLSQGYPIIIKENISFNQLLDLYAKAKIFWLASGFDINEKQTPEKVEHFGMTTVEAMAAGAVPVVIAKGGQREIVERNKNGLLWQTPEELVQLTEELIKNRKVMKKLSENAILRSKDFSKEKFVEKISNLLVRKK